MMSGDVTVTSERAVRLRTGSIARNGAVGGA